MFQTVFPAIIRSSKLHIQHQVFIRPLLLPGASLARLAVMVWQIPNTVCTVLSSWWWTEKPSETCRVSYRNKWIEKSHILLVVLWEWINTSHCIITQKSPVRNIKIDDKEMGCMVVTGFIWLGINSSGRLCWTQWWIFRFHERWGIWWQLSCYHLPIHDFIQLHEIWYMKEWQLNEHAWQCLNEVKGLTYIHSLCACNACLYVICMSRCREYSWSGALMNVYWACERVCDSKCFWCVFVCLWTVFIVNHIAV